MASAERKIVTGESAGEPRGAAIGRLSRNVIWSWAAWAASVVAPLILVPLSVTCLGAQIYGEWLIILSLTSYLGLANLGLGQTVGNRIAEAVARGRRDEVGTLVATAFYAYAAVAALILGAVGSAGPWLGRRFLPGGAAIALLVYVALAAIAFPFKVHQMMLRGYERVDREQALEAGGTAARSALIIGALAAGLKLIAVAVISGGAALAAAFGAYLWAVRMNPAARPRRAHFSWPLLCAMLKPSAAFLALQAGWTLVLGVDNLVIGWALGAGAVTRYAVPFRMIWMAAAAFTVAVNALTPTVTGNYTRDRREPLVRGYLMALRLAILYGVIGAAALWIAGPRLLIRWAGPAVYPGRTTFALQIVAFMLLVWNVPSSTIMWATTRHYWWAALTIAEGLLNLALSLWWVRYWGLAGVIAATIASSLVTNGWYITVGAMRTLGLAPRRMLGALGPGALLGAAAIAVFAPAGGTTALAAARIAAGAALALAFAVIYIMTVFSPIERGAMRAWIGWPMAAA
ncbi:MAG TPA: hypothetical protein VND20_08870 [Candidatus Binataceae bacterium]|nr:hypothetical protein [Candidatus Binataceae bacterium]